MPWRSRLLKTSAMRGKSLSSRPSRWTIEASTRTSYGDLDCACALPARSMEVATWLKRATIARSAWVAVVSGPNV